jgi:hypothetical protein
MRGDLIKEETGSTRIHNVHTSSEPKIPDSLAGTKPFFTEAKRVGSDSDISSSYDVDIKKWWIRLCLHFTIRLDGAGRDYSQGQLHVLIDFRRFPFFKTDFFLFLFASAFLIRILVFDMLRITLHFFVFHQFSWFCDLRTLTFLGVRRRRYSHSALRHRQVWCRFDIGSATLLLAAKCSSLSSSEPLSCTKKTSIIQAEQNK